MSKYHSNGQMIKQDWLDRLTLKEIQKNVKSEKETSKFFYMSIEFAQIKCEDLKYIVLYYEEVNMIKNQKLIILNNLKNTFILSKGRRKNFTNYSNQ